MAVRGGFERCRKEACEEGLILIYRSISTTYHGVIPRSSSRDEEDEEREWWALPCGVESGMDVTPVAARADVRSRVRDESPPLKLLSGSGSRRVEHTLRPAPR
jgi:hypothetical protein